MDHQPSFDQVPLKSLDGREHQFDERSTVRGRKPRWQLFGGLGERVLPAINRRSHASSVGHTGAGSASYSVIRLLKTNAPWSAKRSPKRRLRTALTSSETDTRDSWLGSSCRTIFGYERASSFISPRNNFIYTGTKVRQTNIVVIFQPHASFQATKCKTLLKPYEAP